MNFRRSLVIYLPLLSLAFSGSAFANHNHVRLAKAPAPNCDISGKKHHYKTKESCEKKKGKWLGDDVSSAPAAGTTTPTSATSATSPAGTDPKK